MMTRRTRRVARQGSVTLLMAGLAACVPAPPAPAPAPRPVAPPPPMVQPVAPQPQDWRDVPLTPGRWSWRGAAGQGSVAQFGLLGQSAMMVLRCDLTTRTILFSRAGSLATPTAAMVFTTSFGPFTLTAGNGGGQPPVIVAQATARDPHMDQIAFSRGRFLVDVAGQPRLVLPAWPEVARVIEDCRL